MDKAHKNADKRLAEMERKLSQIYAEASKDIEKKYFQYLEKFSKADTEQRKLLENGEITENNYKKWRKNQIMTGERYKALRDDLARQYTNVNRTAQAYINGQLPPIYVDGYNAIAESVRSSMPGYIFSVVDADTVKNLATQNKTLLPYRYVDGKKDVRWNVKQVNATVLQGILSGESIPKMAKRLQNVTAMNKNAAIRNARTAVTSAENKGRQDSYKRLEEDGAIITRKWLAVVQPGRTRDWHLSLNGETAKVNEPFINDFGKIMYPGDPHAHPANVYNCRCTLTAKVTGFKKVK